MLYEDNHPIFRSYSWPQCCRSETICICSGADHKEYNRGLYFGLKTIFIPSPLWKWYFPPPRDASFFDSYRGLFVLILPYLAFILPFYFPFSYFLSSFFLFLSSFFLFLSPFFLFLLHFPLFSSPFHIFSPKWHRLIFPPPGDGVFSSRPLFFTLVIST
jgi:hypothetical protein